MRHDRIAYAHRRKPHRSRSECRPLLHLAQHGLWAVLGLLLLAVTAQAQDDETWDWPFRESLYLVHTANTAPWTGLMDPVVELLYPSPPQAGVMLAVEGSEVQPVVLDRAQQSFSAWAVALIVAGAVGLLGLVALLAAWQVVRRRQSVQVEAPVGTPEPEGDRTETPAEVPAWGALWVREEDGPVQVFELREVTVTIGRGPESGLRLEDELLSLRHAEVRHEGGAAVLYDLGSTDGTLVNHTRLSGPRRLSPGDVINLGRTELVYRSPARVGGAGGRLMVAQGQSEPAVVDLSSRREVLMGRSESCDVVVQGDPHVSRRHAQVQRAAGGHAIVDLQSTGGVLVNGRSVDRAQLRPGDRIRLGATEFVYEKGGRT